MDHQSHLRALFISSFASSRGMLHTARAAIGALPMIARALLSKANKPIRIIVDPRANTGSTDCETKIVLPPVPLPSSDDDVDGCIAVAAIYYGLIHHEVGHCNHSDIGDFRRARAGLERAMLNIIEDVRMENVHIRELPAARAYLDALSVAMDQQGKLSAPTAQSHPGNVLTGYVLFRAYALYRNEPVALDRLDAVRTVMEQVFTSDLTQRLDELLEEIPTLRDTRGSFDLARKIVCLLQQERDQADTQPESSPDAGDPTEPSDDDAATSDSDDATSQSQDGPDGADDSTDDGDGESGSGTDSEGKDDGQAEGDDDAGGDGQQDCPADDSDGTADSDSDPADDADSDTEGDHDDTDSSDNADTGDQPADAGNEGSGSGDSSETDSNDGSSSSAGSQQTSESDDGSTGDSSQAGTLKGRLDAVLSTTDDAGTDRHDQANALLQELVDALEQTIGEALNLEHAIEQLGPVSDPVHDPLTRLQTGAQHDLDAAYSTAVFVRRKMQSELDAVTNADVSVSNRGRRLSTRHLPRLMAGDDRVFRRKTDGVAPDTAVLLLEDVSGSMNGVPIRIASQALYASAVALEGMDGIEVGAMAFPGNGLVLDFGESPRARADSFQLTAWGGTPMGDGIHVALNRLLDQPQARKLLIVLTDGEPDSSAHALAMIATAELYGIDVYGVGILTDSVQQLFSRWTVISDLSELPERLVALVRDEVMLSIAA